MNSSREDPSCFRVTSTVVHEAKQNARRRRRRPQPWVLLKFMVLVTVAIMCYAFYVFTHKISVPIFLNESNALASLPVAIVTLAIFSILWLWMVWAYVKVVITSPGKATKFVKPSALPVPTIVPPPDYYPLDAPNTTRTTIGGPSYEQIRTSQDASHHQPMANVSAHTTHSIPTNPQTPPNVARIPPLRPNSQPDFHPTHSAHMTLTSLKRDRINARTAMQHHISRTPSTLPILTPERRYCHTCCIVKPYRAHHCSSCGTCILKYDHHCPWIGQCVGARNHKFFVNFTFAAMIFTAYTLVSSLALNLTAQADGSRLAGDWDPQVIILIALAALFGLFTSSLTFSHVYLTLKGQSTVESVITSHFKEKEDEQLAAAYGGCLHGREKKAKRAEWDREWGRIGYEGNIWWLGDRWKEWESVMGSNPIGWILPIGRPAMDGLSYPVNPRFDKEGRWLPRSQWPRDLQEKVT